MAASVRNGTAPENEVTKAAIKRLANPEQPNTTGLLTPATLSTMRGKGGAPKLKAQA